jgi:hypothetical protein
LWDFREIFFQEGKPSSEVRWRSHHSRTIHSMPVDWLEKIYFKPCIAHWGRYTGAPSGATDIDADERLCENGPVSTCHAVPLGLVRGLPGSPAQKRMQLSTAVFNINAGLQRVSFLNVSDHLTQK